MICKHCNGTGIGNPYDTNCLDCGGTGQNSRMMPPTSEDVQKAIHWFSDRSSNAVYMNGEVQPNFHKAHQDVLHTIDNILQQYAPPTSEATQKAIEWQQSLKQHHQREWEKTDVDWQMEPGAQEQHNAMMRSFDMAIAALKQYAPKEPEGKTSTQQMLDEVIAHLMEV